MNSVTDIEISRPPTFWQIQGYRWRTAKTPLCLLLSFSAFFGFLLAESRVTYHTGQLVAGVFFLATGAATLNGLQEYKEDGIMQRTKSRPLPAGQLSFRQAGWQALVLCGLGMLLLAGSAFSFVPLGLGGVALLLYNGVYTRMKQKSVWAIIPGAVCGALPPLIGFTAGGGGVFSFISAVTFALLVLWQVPHFYLILLRYQEDYLGSRQPSFLRLLSEGGIRRLCFPWIMSVTLVMQLFTVLPLGISILSKTLLVFNALFLSVVFAVQFTVRRAMGYSELFLTLNVVLFCHMLIISLGRLSLFQA